MGYPLPYRIVNTDRINYAETSISPHGETERVRYTVPSNCFAFVQHVWIRVRRATAASTLGWVRARVEVLHDGTSVNYVLDCWHRDNTVDSTAFTTLATNIWLLPGDAIRIVTSDASTGGTMDYYVYVNYAQLI